MSAFKKNANKLKININLIKILKKTIKKKYMNC